MTAPNSPAVRGPLDAPVVPLVACVECGGPLQWRCPVCRIAQSRTSSDDAQTAIDKLLGLADRFAILFADAREARIAELPGGVWVDDAKRAKAELESALRVALADEASVTARQLEWDHDSDSQWTDRHHGFSIMLEPDDDLPYCAAWGEGDAEQFVTLDEAQAWCQVQIDRWVAQHALVTPNASMSRPERPTQEQR